LVKIPPESPPKVDFKNLLRSTLKMGAGKKGLTETDHRFENTCRGQKIGKDLNPTLCGETMRLEYRATYINPDGQNVEFDLVKDPISRAYRLSCGDGLRPIRRFLEGGLEFVDFKLASRAAGFNGLSDAQRFMRALLLPPTN
jgi:hypothetical protein